MKRKFLISLSLFLLTMITGCSIDNNNSSTLRLAKSEVNTESNDDCCENSEKEKDALRLFDKYISKVNSVYKNFGVETRNLNEDTSNPEFVSRVIYIDEDIERKSVENTWFGIQYDKHNHIENVGLFIEGYIDSLEDESGNINLDKTIYKELGEVFFRNNLFISDLETSIKNFKTNDSIVTTVFDYDNGAVEVLLIDNKLSVKISLFIK